ncbi:nitrilase family protein [Taibaiella sp. KBW10]|uniref:nitrilase family protein n=1 Tax=Taibaiella sp. KBW10 TaxID=2153357 RepID=UPI000F5A9B61|nr:nitrilase family protein [Taibaiella sp. KBW10]RQO30343.1 nitrilase family protein [Taibaiella sp. KBW10]
MNNLSISLIQTDLHWEQKEENLKLFTQLFTQVPQESQVIVLPEMFSTGFSMQAQKLAEPMDGPTVSWMKTQAALTRKIITGSLIIEAEGKYYNRLIWMQPNGIAHYYDKKHLFGFAGEQEAYTAGEKRVIVQVNGWKINLQVCYDLRFPVWARQNPKTSAEDDTPSYDILLYVANWPERRIEAWDTLLRARAIENQSFVIGVNRIGKDGNDIYHNGSSALIDPWGKVLWNDTDKEAIFTYTFKEENLNEARARLPFLRDRDSFVLL